MTAANDRQQKDLVRQRFTRTAEVFGSYAVGHRALLAESLALAVRAGRNDRAVDIACGPGTLALRFARQVRWICGLDLTPAMLDRARHSAAMEELTNLDVAVGDAQALPFPDAKLDIAVTSYSLHHLPDPARVIREMTRAVKRGGRVGVIDIRASENPKISAMATRIERIRDNSHTRSMPLSEFERIFDENGLRTTAIESLEEPRDFDNWMHVAGWKPGDRQYTRARRLMESTIPDDSAGFHPEIMRPDPTGKASKKAEILQIIHTTLLIAAEKP